MELARRQSGLIVPAALATEQETRTGRTVSRDEDGRRRVVYTNAERRIIDRSFRMLRQNGLGFLIGCLGGFGKTDETGKPLQGLGFHADGSRACGQPMEVVEGVDAGYQCQCTRLHFLRD